MATSTGPTRAQERQAERRAIRADAVTRLGELHRVRAVLLPDQDDPRVLSELSSIESEICAAEAALAGAEGGRRVCLGG